MDGVRCLRCGATRWTLLPGSIEHMLSVPCEICSGPVVVERRRPGAPHGALRKERRDAERRRVPVLPGRR
jgi:hypothetical protein